MVRRVERKGEWGEDGVGAWAGGWLSKQEWWVVGRVVVARLAHARIRRVGLLGRGLATLIA